MTAKDPLNDRAQHLQFMKGCPEPLPPERVPCNIPFVYPSTEKGVIMLKRIIAVACLLVVIAGIAAAQTGVKKKRALPHEFGTVIMNNHSEKAGLPAVEFNHWLHRAMYTCRLCHVDLAFGMKTNSTNIKAADNKKGFYCGTCHNGKMLHKDKPIFASCQTQATRPI